MTGYHRKYAIALLAGSHGPLVTHTPTSLRRRGGGSVGQDLAIGGLSVLAALESHASAVDSIS